MATANDNLGVLYLDLKQPKKAKEYHLTAIKLNLEREDELLLAQSYNYLGNVFRKTNQPDSALYYYQKSLEIFTPAQEKQWLAVVNINIASIYYNNGEYSKALEFCLTSFSKASEVGAIINIEEASGLLHKLYAKTGQPAKAYETHLLYVKMRDSINNEKGKKEVLRQEFKHQYEKKTAADKLINDARIKQEQTQRYALYGGLAIVFIFSFFLYRRFRVTKKQNVIIREQKKVVEEKQKEIIDSIHYAKRIQQALLPNEKYIERTLNNKNTK
jgi:tetratricopeptide (TPR) repeat protein